MTTYGNQKAPLARHFHRWKFFDPGRTFKEWSETLRKTAEWADEMATVGAVFTTNNEKWNDDYWYYTIPGHHIDCTDDELKEIENEELEYFEDDGCECERE